MRTFKDFFACRVDRGPLSELYRTECHICARTVKIFEKLEKQDISLNSLAQALAVDIENLSILKEGDCCDPHLVIRLCRHLGLTPPPDCPKLTQG